MRNNQDFKVLFYKHHPRLILLAYSFTRSKEVAEELVQDVFINLWQKKIMLSDIDSIEGYLNKSVKNTCLNYLKSKYHKDHSGFLEIDAADHSHHVQSEDKLEINELSEAIEKGIQQLPSKCRIVFLLSRDKKLSYDEIASHLGVTKETVKSQIKIAIKRLKEHLARHGL
jgi:RNA polymerase sigma-70 factor (family 1)